jgi:hypothetical protein
MIDLPRISANSPIRNVRGSIEYRFELEGIPETTVHVRVFQPEASSGEEWEYTSSHWIKTPTQIGVYTPSAPFGSSPQAAIEKAIRDYTVFYSGAVNAGHAPNPSWLVPSRSWDN